MEKVPISRFKTNCLAVLGRVRKTGKPILVTRYGKPIAKIIPAPRPSRAPNWLGAMQGRSSINGNIVVPAANPSDWEATGPPAKSRD